MTFPAFQQEDVKSDISQKLPDQQFLLFTTKEEDLKTAETKKPNRAHEYEKENTRSVCLLEQKRKVVSSNIDVPPARKSSEELDMDKVTAAMVLTSLSTSPLVRSPPVRPNGKFSTPGQGLWGGVSGLCTWGLGFEVVWSMTCIHSGELNSVKFIRCNNFHIQPCADKTFSVCIWIRPTKRQRESSWMLSGGSVFLAAHPAASSSVRSAVVIPSFPFELGCDEALLAPSGVARFFLMPFSEVFIFYGVQRTFSPCVCVDSLGAVSWLSSPESCRRRRHLVVSYSFPWRDSRGLLPHLFTLKIVFNGDYQATPPVNIPGSTKFTPNGSSFSISWQSPPVTFTGIPVSPTHNRPAGSGEQKQSHTVLSSPPRVAFGLRKPRGEGKKCRKVYGMENRDMWCTACRWKKACQRFID
ncbi:ZN704 protein, partial [Hemiprocne comata]|nr:ZN704 protein [Hemiprocne comata]